MSVNEEDLEDLPVPEVKESGGVVQTEAEEKEDVPGREEEEDLSRESEEDEEWDSDPLPPLVPQEEKELLFLMEFLVDTLRLRPGALRSQNLDPCNLLGQNCVVLTFMHFPPMSICENDMVKDKSFGGEKCKLNSGKSLLFALTETQFADPPPVFLEVSTYKEMPHGFAFPKLQMGETKIDLTELFRIVFDKYDEKPHEMPVGKSIKDNYVLMANGEETADIDIYIRLTCLGGNIVTNFQTSEDCGNLFLFKNLESEKVYECKEANKKLPCSQTGDKTNKLSSRRRPDPEDENYEEIFAEINGSVLTVTFEKSARRAKPKQFHVDDFCDCDIPLPPDLVEGVSDASSSSVSVPVKSPLPDGAVGKCGNTIVFQVPPGNKLGDSNVHYNVNTCKEGKKHGHAGKSFKIVTSDDVYRPQMPNCPEKDVFELRIMKKGKSKDGKGALDLTFKTPKEKIVPPPKPPYMIEKAVGPEKQKEKK